MDLEIPAATSAEGPYPPREGNLVIPWIDGVPFYERLAAALRAARRKVWAIVSFIEPAFRFPDGDPWWAHLGACQARGVDVRVLFWRNPRFFKTAHVLLGGPEDRALLAARGAAWAARWDASEAAGHCHHQKAFVIDEGDDDAIAFVGGMVLSSATLARPGHRRGHEKHDAFLELRGPAVADAAHNFVQRWNFARLDPEAPPWPDLTRADPLPWPSHVPRPCGGARVQLARTIQPGLYPGVAAPGAARFDSLAGESTILAHYRRAFAAARRTIYLENQHPGEAALLGDLDDALRRGVRVVMVVPGEPMAAIGRAAAEVDALGERAAEHRYGPTFRGLAALGEHHRFTLAALARSDPAGAGAWTHREIYTHAKLCVVDGAWATLGSANLVDLSLRADHSELNAAVWGRDVCLPLLRGLVGEHTDAELGDDVDDASALRRFADLARRGRRDLLAGGPLPAGCYALDPRTYARGPALTRGLTPGS